MTGAPHERRQATQAWDEAIRAGMRSEAAGSRLVERIRAEVIAE